jgi:hypothetical protein
MVNFVETLFGLAAAGFVVAISLLLMGRKLRARRVALAAVIVGVAAVLGELYLRFGG